MPASTHVHVSRTRPAPLATREKVMPSSVSSAERIAWRPGGSGEVVHEPEGGITRSR